MKKFTFILFAVILCILLLGTVIADDIDVAVTDVEKNAETGGLAKFSLDITNNKDQNEVFAITPDPFGASPFSDIFESIIAVPSTVSIPSHDSRTVEVSIRVLEQVKPGRNYRTFVLVKSTRTDSKKEVNLVVTVVPPKELVTMTTNLPNDVFPGKGINLDVDLKNNIDLTLDPLDLVIKSDFFEYKDTLRLFPYQDTTKKVTFDISSLTPYGTYTLSISGFYKGKLRSSYVKDFNVVKNPDVKEDVATKRGFLVDTIKLTKINGGNSIIDERFVIPLTKKEQLFTSFSKEPTKITDENVGWSFDIGPGETEEITITTDYRLFALAVLIAVFVLFYFAYKVTRTITVEKSMFRVKERQDGITELKVIIHVKNNGGSVLRNVRVTDLLLRLMNPINEYITLKPVKIQKGELGLRMIWELNELSPGEERIISYRVESKLHIIGRAQIPPALLTYMKNKRIYHLKSNRLTFSGRLLKE